MGVVNHRSEALSLVDDILRRADRRLTPVPWTYIVWGCVGPLYYAPYFRVVPALPEALAQNLGLLATVVAIALSIWEFRRATTQRLSYLDRQAFATFAFVTTLLWTLKIVWNGGTLVSGTAFALIWSLGFAIALVIVGFGGGRPLLAGGCVLLAAIFAGSLYPFALADILAAGNLVGIAGTGVWYLTRRA